MTQAVGFYIVAATTSICTCLLEPFVTSKLEESMEVGAVNMLSPLQCLACIAAAVLNNMSAVASSGDSNGNTGRRASNFWARRFSVSQWHFSCP